MVPETSNPRVCMMHAQAHPYARLIGVQVSRLHTCSRPSALKKGPSNYGRLAFIISESEPARLTLTWGDLWLMYLGRRPDASLASGSVILPPPRCNSVAVPCRSLPIRQYISCPRAFRCAAIAPTRLARFKFSRRFSAVFVARACAHDPPVTFLRRILTGRADSDRGSRRGRVTDTSATDDISLLNYNE